MILWQWLSGNRARLWRWGGALGGFALAQVFVQLLNAASGFLLVHAMEKPAYAWYTVASGMSAALSVLADAGIGGSVTSQGGAVWQSRPRLSALVAAALLLRYRTSLMACGLLAPLSIWMLVQNGCGLIHASVLTLIVLAPVWCASSSSIYNVVNRLHSRTRQLQAAEMVPALLRTALTGGLVLAGWADTITALLAVLAGHLFQWWLVRRQMACVLSFPPEEEMVREALPRVRQTVREMLPSCLFVALQAQITPALISVFASTSQVADFGALSRLAVIFTAVGAPMINLVAPAVARAQDVRRLRRLFVLTLACAGSFCAGAVILAAWRGDLLLWMLGHKYAHLESELVLVMTAMVFGCLNSVFWSFNFARGWTRFVWLNIPLTLTTQCIGAALLPLQTVMGAAWLSNVVAGTHMLHSLTILAFGLLRAPLPCEKESVPL